MASCELDSNRWLDLDALRDLLRVALIIGYRTRLAAFLSGLLTLAFAIGMIVGLGIHAPLNYSVFAVSAGSFLLAEAERYPWALDHWRDKTHPYSSVGQERQPAA